MERWLIEGGPLMEMLEGGSDDATQAVAPMVATATERMTATLTEVTATTEHTPQTVATACREHGGRSPWGRAETQHPRRGIRCGVSVPHLIEEGLTLGASRPAMLNTRALPESDRLAET